MQKDTNDLVKELSQYSSFRSFYSDNSPVIAKHSLSECLQELIEKKGLSKAEIIEASEMSEVYAYQILSGIRKTPQRNKVLCLAFGMGLELNEVQDLLKKTGYPVLYVKIPFDCVVMYGLCKKMSVVEVNELLYEYGQETLG